MQENATKKKIVLVEDEEILANLIKQKFESSGFEVKHAADGEAGLSTIIAEKPDLVLLDILLPRKNGFEVLEGMKEAKMLPATPVIIISNSGQEVEMERAWALGIKDHLVKINFDPEELVTKVRDVLEGKTQKVEKAAAPPGGESILVVEDDIFLGDLLCRKLRERFTVHQAIDAAKAKEILESGKKIDAICLDIILPGMDGVTFLRSLRANEKFKKIPVLIVSNLGQREEIEKGMEAGASGYLVKANVSLDEIVKRVESLLVR